MLKEPFEKFQQTYKQGMQSLSAKEGFGKKYGLSRRVAQEKLRAEMTNCEMA